MRNQQGQSIIEYVLLMLVIMTMLRTISQSETIQNFFGPEGKFSSEITKQMEHTYQHGYSSPVYNGVIEYGTVNHPGYKKDGESRFFTGTEAYGAE